MIFSRWAHYPENQTNNSHCFFGPYVVVDNLKFWDSMSFSRGTVTQTVARPFNGILYSHEGAGGRLWMKAAIWVNCQGNLFSKGFPLHYSI